MGSPSLRPWVLTALLRFIFPALGLGWDLPFQQWSHNVVVFSSLWRLAFPIFRVDECKWNNRFQWWDDKEQHEADKKLEAVEHFHDADISKDMSLRDLLGDEMPGHDKLLLPGDPLEQQKDPDRFQLQLLLYWNQMYPWIKSFHSSSVCKN